MLKKAYLEITNVCNLSCAFCPGTRREKGFLTPEGFGLLTGKLRPHTEYLYLHLMGEPLLHPQLGEILARAEALGFRVMGVQRNAGYKNGRWIDLLWFEKAIAPCDVPPAPLTPIGMLPGEQVRAILDRP